ncbi:3-oxoacyl-ACP synthase [Solidesulfovibrio carbinolicus]|uniref:3-oxoacyl-ACP synthase n=2 Tax=Solidesulfovibrio carbinolicus TaxID=296842 RepID=A0A4P6HRS7_9BACT|nr:3-oxoacyl-ACP synthase [Solidesulfovibrio carbinolicus]
MAREDGTEEFDFAKAKFANIDDIAALMKQKQPKQAISIRLDAEVLNWYRSHGKGYQTLIGELLTAYMQSQVGNPPKAKKTSPTKAQAVHARKSRITKAACSK